MTSSGMYKSGWSSSIVGGPDALLPCEAAASCDVPTEGNMLFAPHYTISLLYTCMITFIKVILFPAEIIRNMYIVYMCDTSTPYIHVQKLFD